MRVILSLVAFAFAVSASGAEPASPRLKVLFLGDDGHHRPADRFKQLQPVFAKRGIDLTYTDKLTDLNAKTLGGYDALMIYANQTKISPEQEKALIDFVEGGKGVVPVHCASYCFLNSPKYVALVGAQFRSHNTGTFRTQIVKPEHPLMKGFQNFTSWDETYVHTKHNEKGRTVLEVRAEGELKEPWTWVREQGKGRVFYTAWGHDQRTWGHEGFQNLLERGVRWACGQDPALAGNYFDKPEMTSRRKDVKPFEYVEAKVPFYPPSRQWGVQAKPRTTMQKPLSVEESQKHFITPVDFEVKVFVTEEKLGGKPIAMNWDEQGRLFVSITADYPNERKPSGEGRDRIVVCEDTDGDGVCDKVTTFAEKLSIASSLLPYAGGLIVHQAPVTLFLKDTDGDGKADVRQELFRGWSTGDTHAGPSNLHYGFDNWVYGSVGYAGFRGTVGGQRHNFRQGFYRFKVEANPDQKAGGESPLKVTKLEFLRSTSNNTWGLCFDERGELFGSTANGCPIVHMPIPNRYYELVRGLTPSVLQNIAPDNHFEPITENVRQVDFHGGFTAASNIAIYTARTYPREYWNRTAFISEPTGHLTATMMLRPDGASFQARYGWNIVASDDEWTAPIDAQVGPDGHVWMIDWYNYIVQHNPTPAGFKTGKGAAYETNLRDKTHGRIYRVVYKKAKPEKPFTLKDATPEKLIETLKHPNMTWRLHAQRLLVDRGKADVMKGLMIVAGDRKSDETAVIHALATLSGLQKGGKADKNTIDALRHATRHHDAAVRRFAFNVLGTIDGPSTTNELIVPGVSDSDPTVRVAALLALADRGSRLDAGEVEQGASGTITSKSIVQALKRLDNLDDTNIRVALTVAAAAHARSVLASLSKEQFPASALPIIESTAAAAVRRPHGGSHVARTFGALIEADPAVRDAIASGIAAGWSANARPELTADDEQIIGKSLGVVNARSRAKLIKLASTWGVKGIDKQLAELTKAAFGTLADAKAKDADRIAAALQVVEFQPNSDDAATKLLAVVTADASPALVSGVFEALALSKAKRIGAAVVEKLKTLPVAARPAALRLVLAKADSTKAFLDAVEKGTLRFDMLALDQRQALASHPDRAVSERAKKILELGGGLPNADRQKVIEELKTVLLKGGSIENGKKMFTTHCAKCHKHGNEGTAIGPDLTGFSVHPKEEMMIAVLDPSRSVEGNFKLYRVQTADDRSVLGILGAQTGTSVEIIDAEAKRHALAKDDIVSMKETDKSLMPEGFEKVMKPQELADLLEFLSQKGKYVPLPLDKVATVVSTKGMFYDEASTIERLIFRDWKPKMVGEVPFVLVDPQKDRKKNVVLLHSPNGSIPPKMPKSVSLPFNGKAKAIHLLGGVGGWAAPFSTEKTVSMIVRITYDDGKTEEHELKNAVHIADYIRKVDVPGSKFAFALQQQQVRYLSIPVKRPDVTVKSITLVKGPDRTAPIVMAVTVETP